MKAKFLRDSWSGGPLCIKGINERLIIDDIICAVFDEDGNYIITFDGIKKYGEEYCFNLVEDVMKKTTYCGQFWSQDYAIGGGYYFVNNEVEIEI